MDHHHRNSSDDDKASDQSIKNPLSFNGDGNQPEEIFQWKTKTFDELKRSIVELNSEFDKNYETIFSQIKELNDITDELASAHKNTAVGSLAATVMGAAGGITSLAGLCLAPFTSGASLALAAVGVAAGVAGGATGATFSLTNIIKQKNLRQKIEKIISDFQNTINPMIQLLSAISNSTEVTEQLEKQMFKQHEGAEAVRGAAHLLKIVYVAEVAQIGKACAEAAKAFHAAAKMVHMAVAITGALSALFLALDVVGIVQDFTEISEMKQPAAERKAEDIKSETLKFLHQMRETAAQFQKTLNGIKDAKDGINKLFNKQLQNCISSQVS